MKVYIVQQLRWVYNDEFFDKDFDKPLKAFIDRNDAEFYCEAMETLARQLEAHEVTYDDNPEIYPHEDLEFDRQFFEIIEADIS